MKYRYVPMLRSKTGEANALLNLDSSSKDRIFPLIHLSQALPASFVPKTSMAWIGRLLAIDGAYNFDIKGNLNDYMSVFGALGTAGVRVIPTAICGAPAAYNKALSPLIGKYSPGLVIKVSLNHLKNLQSFAADFGLSNQDVDVVVDLESITTVYTPHWAEYVAHSLKTDIDTNHKWRSITLASSTAPKDYGQLSQGRNVVQRLDWLLWLAASSRLPYKLDYGDYATLHPDMTEPPGAAMARATVSIRYTCEQEWLVYKGTGTGGPSGTPMSAQYLAHAKRLVKEIKFGGLIGCWADDRILKIAAGTISSGSRTTWAENAVNRHLCFLAAKLP